jgi:hypothetical protein
VRNDTVVVAAETAFTFYKRHGAYVCQDGRAFRDVHYLAFYRDKRIMPFIPTILDWHDHVAFTRESADRLLDASATDRERALGTVVWNSVLDGSRYDGDVHEVLMLTPQTDERTVRLERAIRHHGDAPWTRGQRYADIDALRACSTTDELEAFSR